MDLPMKDQSKTIPVDPTKAAGTPTKQQLYDEVKYVFDGMEKLDFKAEAIPDVIYLISSSWFDKWKSRVNYTRFQASKKASVLKGTSAFSAGAAGTGSAQPAKTSTAATRSLGSWGNANLSLGGAPLSLGAKAEAERRFNEEKAAEKQRQSENQAKKEEEKKEQAAQKEDEGLTAESCFSDEHMTKLEPLSPITNSDLLQDFASYIRDNDSKPNSTNIENFVLRSGLDFERDVVAVSEPVYSFLANKYGADFALPRSKAAKCETWRWSIKEKYDVMMEEVRLLIMKHEDEPCSQIEIRARDGSVMSVVPKVPQFKTPTPKPQAPTVAPVPASAERPIPAATATAIPKPPALPPASTPLNVQKEAPKPPAAPALPPAPVPGGVKAPPAPPGVPRPPPLTQANIKPQKTFGFSLQHQSIYVKKSQTLTSMKARIAAHLNLAPEAIRLWSFEYTAGQSLDSVATALVRGSSAYCLSKCDYSPWSSDKITSGPLLGAEVNKGVLFPGKSLDVVECHNRLIGSFNKKAADKNSNQNYERLCREKELVVVETLDKDGHFTFKFSSSGAHYAQCKRALGTTLVCGRIGLLEKVICECGKIHYCSEACAAKDTTHRDKCPEYKKKLLDPDRLDMEVAADPKNGICGLQNLGNTCYMNSALQCISHTMPMVHYFCRSALFKQDLNYKNPLASKHCELAILFVKLLRELWNTPKGKSTGYGSNSYSPTAIKTAIGNINGLFKGYQQHDSNELIQFLLDQLHEDLNRVDQASVKPTFAMPTHEEVAAEKLSDEQLTVVANEAHLKLNESVIQDLFFGQLKSTITCDKCKIPSKKIEQFMTLPVNIPQLSFNLKFTFVPYAPNEKLFSFELRNISTEGDQSLYQLKKKISEIAKHYFKDTHFDSKHNKHFKWPLTTRGQNSIELTAHDILLASVAVGNGLPLKEQRKFVTIFGDHRHTLADVQAEIEQSGAGAGVEIMAYQLDPWAIDVEKVAAHELNGTGHELTFPQYLKPGYILVPVELGALASAAANQNTQPAKPLQPFPLPPRLALIHKSWTIYQVFYEVMSIFIKCLDNKSAQGYSSGYQQMTQQQHGRRRPPRRSRLRDHVVDHDYEMNHNLSDDDDAHNQIPGGRHGFGDSPQEQNGYQYDAQQQGVQTLNHKVHYTFEELFGHLNMYYQQTGKYPTLEQLDHIKSPTSDWLQPLGLYVVTANTDWHVMLSESKLENLLGTLMDKETFGDSNNGIFVTPNPERANPPPPGKPKILKFKLLYSLAHLPDDIGAGDVLRYFANPDASQIYKKNFEFDDQYRIRSASSDSSAGGNQINSAPGKHGSAASSSALTLDQCLKSMSKLEHLTGSNQYDCLNCKSKQNATKLVQLHKTPPVFVLTLQRFKNGQKNSELVKFPRLGLDMLPLTLTKDGDAASHVYDLYGVVNHSGSLGFGHYTAMCFNEIEEKWHNFNDSMVSEVKPQDLDQDLVTPRAYVLFYARRGFECADQEDFNGIKVSSTGAADWLFKKAKEARDKEEEMEKQKAAKEGKNKVAEDPPNFKGQGKGNQNGQGAGAVAEPAKEAVTAAKSAGQNPLAAAPDADPEDLQQIEHIKMMSEDKYQNFNQSDQIAADNDANMIHSGDQVAPGSSLAGQIDQNESAFGHSMSGATGPAAGAPSPSDSDEGRKED